MAHKKHEKIIKEWLAGAKIEYKNAYDDWCDVGEDQPGFFKDIEYRIKPAEPERATYPVTQMSDLEIKNLYSRVTRGSATYWEDVRTMINEGIHLSIDAGQIVTREEFDRAITDRKERDMAVAMAVLEAAASELKKLREGEWIFSATDRVDLEAIIAEVK